MGKFIKGDVVVVPFPFSDLTDAKRRPALVIADFQGDDYLLVQITSKTIKDESAVPLSDDDFSKGGLKKESNIRPNRIFTADSKIILYKAGTIKNEKLDEVINKIIRMIQK